MIPLLDEGESLLCVRAIFLGLEKTDDHSQLSASPAFRFDIWCRGTAENCYSFTKVDSSEASNSHLTSAKISDGILDTLCFYGLHIQHFHYNEMTQMYNSVRNETFGDLSTQSSLITYSKRVSVSLILLKKEIPLYFPLLKYQGIGQRNELFGRNCCLSTEQQMSVHINTIITITNGVVEAFLNQSMFLYRTVMLVFSVWSLITDSYQAFYPFPCIGLMALVHYVFFLVAHQWDWRMGNTGLDLSLSLSYLGDAGRAFFWVNAWRTNACLE